MLTSAGCQQRRDRLWDALPADVEWVLVGDPRHVAYLCGFWVNPFSFSLGERSLLLLFRDGQARLFADNFTRRSAVAPPHDVDEVIATWYDHRHSVENRDRVLSELFRRETNLDPGRGMAEGAALSVHSIQGMMPALRVDLGDLLRDLRRWKHEDEVALLQRCMQACEAGHARALEVIDSGMTEFDLYCEVQLAAERASGGPAIVYGDFRATNAGVPKAGGMPTDTVLQPGDLFLLDYSVVIQGYRSDFTNTLAVGEPTDEQRRLFDACRAAMASAEEAVVVDGLARDVYHAASSVLENAGYGPLAHHAGHGLGLAHPEPPIFVPESDDVLGANDVITIEPGAYIPGVGGVRVEHNYLVTEDGLHRLSQHEIRLGSSK